MAAGLPAVVSDAPGNIEALGDAGYVAIRGDVRSLASSFRELAGDAARRRTLGDQARARAGALFDAEVMVAATRQIYDEAVAR
jgi:glycosyltransferase involved in cell wall biosynthesis